MTSLDSLLKNMTKEMILAFTRKIIRDNFDLENRDTYTGKRRREERNFENESTRIYIKRNMYPPETQLPYYQEEYSVFIIFSLPPDVSPVAVRSLWRDATSSVKAPPIAHLPWHVVEEKIVGFLSQSNQKQKVYYHFYLNWVEGWPQEELTLASGSNVDLRSNTGSLSLPSSSWIVSAVRREALYAAKPTTCHL